ncbi:MAG: hypothetical protein ACRBB6_04145 [Neptuniibacter sp.]
MYIGIDPGEKGAICAVLPSEQKAIFMKTTEKPIVIAAWFKEIQEHHTIRMIMVEDVGPVQGTSAGSNFKFGYNAGVVNTLARVSGCPVDLVKPKVWQKEVGLSISSKLKDAARKKAIKNGVADICERLYPQVNIRGPKGGLLDGMSDALMIAHFGLLKYP